MNRIYFDISATTPIDKKVASHMDNIHQNIYGNPSSIHREGQSAKAIIEKSRRKISNILNCEPNEIIFTSSGSESNNMVVKGVLKSGDHFITSSYEHPAILKIIPWLKNNDIKVTLVNPDKNGIIQPKNIEDSITSNTKLISIMYVNNELGTINPINDISKICKKNNVLFHSDAVQAVGKININIKNLDIDFLSMSAHKLYGPKGVGALYKKEKTSIDPLIYGGSQESNLRASTENIAGIAGFGLATELAYDNIIENNKHINLLECTFIELLKKKKIKYKINGINKIPGVFNITFPNIDGKNLVIHLDMQGIGISFGAACASGSTQVANFLLEMGLNEKEALSTVRISFGKIHSINNIKYFVDCLEEIIHQLIKNKTIHV